MQIVEDLTPDRLEGAVALAGSVYWNEGIPAETLRRAHLGSTVWVGAVAPDGALAATARAISDGAKWAWIYDVVVAEAWRGKGVGDAVLRHLLAHDRLRDCRIVMLSTRDAEGFYERLGFVQKSRVPPRPWRSIEMALIRES